MTATMKAWAAIPQIFSAKSIRSVERLLQPIQARIMDVQAQRLAALHDPRPQPYYEFERGIWRNSTGNQTASYKNPLSIKLISWNIDFMAPAPLARMTRAMSYIQELISSLSPAVAPVILLQEITPPDLDVIQKADWVRKSFYITETSSKNWQHEYGTITLVDRRLKVASVFRIRYVSNMGRDALFVDLEDMNTMTLRICNTHLESLTIEPPLRPAQVELAARYMKDPTVNGAVIAGDFNAIQDFDKTMHIENGLKDSYLECGGEEGHEDGWTWGMQCASGRDGKYPCTRMDKVLYCGNTKVQDLRRIGAGVKVDVKWRAEYVTDHLGLIGDVSLLEDE